MVPNRMVPVGGVRPGVGPLQASKSGLGGTAGATSTEWWLFCSSVPRSGASRGRNAPFFREPNIRIYFFGMNVRIVSFLALNIQIASRAQEVVGLVLAHQSQDVAR